MKCVGCGREIGPGSKFCKYCGITISQSMKVNQEKGNIGKCTVCGEVIAPGNVFCVNCGAPIDKKQNKTVKKNTGKKTVRILLVISLLVAIALIAAIVFYFFNIKNKGEQKDDTSDVPHLRLENDVSDDTGETDNVSETFYNDDIDVEECVEDIRGRYNDIVSKISSGDFEKTTIGNGITAYYENADLKAIIDAKDSGSTGYRQWYYYEGDELFFAYYESNDAHRFYFSNEQLIRWRYSVDAADSQNAVNHDLEDTSEYRTWERSVLDNAMTLKNDWEWTLANGSEAGEYILEGSDSRYISEYELDMLTKEEVKLARNELYARHGRKFDDVGLRAYFSQFDWYNPTIDPADFGEWMLNDYEIANRDLIVQYEEEHGYK